MIKLVRNKHHKWIFQKNISSTSIMTSFVNAIEKNGNVVVKQQILDNLKRDGVYKGRSEHGNSGTMGVRFSEMKFYMFGYTFPESNIFYPSPTTRRFLDNGGKINGRDFLVNLFSIQFPHPFSNTESDFKICAGRFICKLLREKRLEYKLYIDEACYFIPFIEKIDDQKYYELVDSILEFRKLNYYKKLALFKEVDDFDDVFSNVFHEFNYYFLRIFRDLGVLDIVGDKDHNDGLLFSFIHGNCGTRRNDAFESGAKYSGFFKIKDDLSADVDKLLGKFHFSDKPIEESDPDILSRKDFVLRLYQTNQMLFLNCLGLGIPRADEAVEAINTMAHMSRFSSDDGKEFEQSLTKVFRLFLQANSVEWISGAGDTDVLCSMFGNNNVLYKINVDGKKALIVCESLNSRRLLAHIEIHGSLYCIVVSSRFAPGAIKDIQNHNIVAINADSLANYLLNECNTSPSNLADYSIINDIATSNFGCNISNIVDKYVEKVYGFH